jgi:hypothetical protein
LLEDDVMQPGVWLPEQVIDPNQFFAGMAERGLHVCLGDPL